MPYKSEKIKLNEKQDRRRKLTNKQKMEIKDLYSTNNFSLNKLAKMYEVSKKTILLIVNPESNKRAKEYRKENWKNWQGTKEERNEATRNHRRYKQNLYLKGELQDDNINSRKS